MLPSIMQFVFVGDPVLIRELTVLEREGALEKPLAPAGFHRGKVLHNLQQMWRMRHGGLLLHVLKTLQPCVTVCTCAGP